MRADVRVRLLGPIEVVAAGLHRPVAGLRKRAVLAALALQVRQVVSADDLIDVVWNGGGPVTALNALQSHVSSLRREPGLREAILARAPGYLFDLGTACTDVEVMEELLRRAAEEADPARRAGLLRSALGWWRGPALAGLADLTWFADQAARLDGVRRGALSSLTEARLVLGEHGALVGELEHLAERYPFDEELHRQLMVALYRCGRPGDALTVFGRLRRRLADELGVDPGPVLRGLQSSILRHDEALTLPGTTEPAGAGRVVARPAAREGALVERAAEMSLLERALAEARAGTGSVVLFEGPAGIGKSALLGHARARARELGFNLAAAVGRQLETTYDWGCARQLFEGPLFGPLSFSAETPASDAHGELPTPPGRQPESDLERSEIHALYRLMVKSCERGPLLVTLDDLQWCDLPSVRLMAYLAARACGLPMVLLGTSRPGAAEIDQALTGLARFTRVLAPLSVNGCAAVLGHGGEELAQQCHELTGGSPLLVREFGRHLGDERGVERGAASVRRLVQAQVRQLPPGAAGVAQALAVWRGPAGAEAVAATARIDVAEAMHHLAALRANQLVAASDGGRRFALARPLICEAVYEGVGSGVRAGLHVRAAGVALRVGDVVGAGSQLLRVPAGWGGEVDAVGVLGEAARVCLVRGAVDSAVAFLRRLLEEDLGEGRGGVLTRLGMAEFLVDTGAAVGHLAAGLALETDPETRARTALTLAAALHADGQPAEAMHVAQDALPHSPDPLSSTHRALQAMIVDTAIAARHLPHIQPLVQEWRDRPPGSTAGDLMLQAALAVHAALRNDRVSALRRASAVATAADLGRQPFAVHAAARAWQVLTTCDAPEALPAIDAFLTHVETIGSRWGQTLARCHRGAVLLAHGDVREAVDDLRLSWAQAVRHELRLGKILAGSHLMIALLRRGDVDAADTIRSQLEDGPALDVTNGLRTYAEASLLLAQGRTTLALARAIALRDQCRVSGITNAVDPDWRTLMIRCLTDLGRGDEALETAQEFIGSATTWGTARAIGRSLAAMADVEHARRRTELLHEAAKHFQAAEARWELAQSLHRLGESMRQTGSPMEAREHLRRAHEIAVACGAEALARDAAGSLRLLGTRVRTEQGGRSERLTPAERRVVELATAGHRNREIAHSLFIRLKTVETHLTSAYRKLGVSGRGQLAQVSRASDSETSAPAGIDDRRYQ
ncbi:BTAD domain-containing putative transcriptional regulator [Micromonospora sp. NPDC049240]|uniref:BTAD domain-containing putative transcriptional regulator n=1 Tax=Micromonospora sp. NPDC049240 TaxID=3155151 RepID=UPI0033EB41AB